MRFSAWMAQQEEIVPRLLPALPGNYNGYPLIAGQPNYVLEQIQGAGAAAAVQGFIVPATRAQLERLRDRLNQMFPPPAAGPASGATAAGS